MDSNSIPRTERYSLTLRQLVQCGCQKTLIAADILSTSLRSKGTAKVGINSGSDCNQVIVTAHEAHASVARPEPCAASPQHVSITGAMITMAMGRKLSAKLIALIRASLADIVQDGNYEESESDP